MWSGQIGNGGVVPLRNNVFTPDNFTHFLLNISESERHDVADDLESERRGKTPRSVERFMLVIGRASSFYKVSEILVESEVIICGWRTVIVFGGISLRRQTVSGIGVETDETEI